VEKVISGAVISTVDKDWRNMAGYLVEFTLSDVEAGTTRIARFERTWEEFKHLDALARSKGWFGPKVPPLPSAPEVGPLDEYLRSFVASPSLNPSQYLDDFAAINYKDCFELKWFKDALSLPYIFTTRQPSFWPSPPNITRETVQADETPFECWLYIMSWQSHKNTSVFQPVLDAYTARMPEFELGFPQDSNDVWAPGVQTEPRYPAYYTKTPVHFLPGGFKNSRNIRLSYLGRNKFSFLEASNLDAWIQKLSPIYGRPKRILDVGTGQCFSAFAFNRAYPEAEVVGIDLSAGQIRFCRMWAEKNGTKNLAFYHANAEDLPFASGSFDIVQYTYVLHEMPERNALRVISEMWRVLKPGGVLSGFEVPYFEFGVERKFLTDIFTWGKDWNSSTTQGPEPYFGEFENFNLIKQLKNEGTNEPVTHCSTVFDAVVTLVKSPGQRPVAQAEIAI
jgi:ubiquinone/menaquinone biosynthesis C-methylase UbiE